MKTPAAGHSKLGTLCASEAGTGSLLGILAAVTIMAILALLLLGGPQIFQNKGEGGPGSAGGGKLGGAIAVRDTAKDSVCRNNLQQLRMAVQLYLANGEGNPEHLEQLKEATPGLQISCPVSGEPYEYDPGTASVRCPHAAHQKY